MRNPPPINRNPPPILLSPRPLHGQISITHQRLPDIIKAVVDMVFLMLQQRLIGLSGSVEVHSRFEREQEGPHVVKAVQLVEDGDVVDLAHAFVCGLAGREGEVFGVGDEDEAITGGRQVVAPGFVGFGC